MKKQGSSMLFFIILSALLILGLAACGQTQDSGTTQENDESSSQEGEQSSAPSEFKGVFVTGSAGGVFNTLGGGMTKVINGNLDNVNLNATTPPSVSKTPGMLNEGEAAFGFGMADMMNRAINGEGEFEKKHENVRTLMAVYNNVMSAIVLDSTSIKNISEVKGAKVGVPSESTKGVVANLFEEAGVPEDQVDWQYLTYTEQESALRDGNIDVMIATVYPKSGLIEGLASRKDIHFLKIDEDVKNSFNEKYPLVQTSEVPGGIYPGVEEGAEFYTVYTVLYTNKDVPDDVAYDTVKTIFDNHDEIAAVHPAGEMISLDLNETYIEMGLIDVDNLHEGSKKFFEEQGLLK